MARHNIIILLTGERAAAYIDRGRKSEVVSRARNPEADVAEEVDSLLASLPTQAGKVWVLSSELWTGSIGLANDVIRRVEKQQLPQLAGYEVEPLSGINGAQARTAVTQLGMAEGQKYLWVTQAESDQFARITESVSFNGGKLQGLLHPAGVPRPVGLATGEKSWTRLEIWNDAAMVVTGSGKSIEWQFVPEAASAIYDPAHLEYIRQQYGGNILQVLFDSASLAAPADSSNVEFVSLDDQAVLKAVLQSWAQALVAKPSVPLIAPQRAPMSARSKQLLGAGLAAAVIIGCFGHYQISAIVSQAAADGLKKQVAELEAPIKAAKEEQKKLTELQKQQADLVAKQESLEKAVVRYQEVMIDQRQRIPTLLKSLAKSCDQQMLIQEIASDGSEIRIQGRCLDPRQAKSLATELAKDLEAMNFSVELPTTEALNLTSNGGPHQFEVVLRDRSG